MLDVFRKSTNRKHIAERKLELQTQQKIETYTSYIEYILFLIKLANKEMLEPEQLKHLFKGMHEKALRVLLFVKLNTGAQFSSGCLRLQELFAFQGNADSTPATALPPFRP